MLRRSFPVVFGDDLSGQPITWSGFNRFSRALGEPDYAEVVDEDLDASPLYLKFLDDAARDACGKVLAADAQRSDRTFLRYAGATDAPASAAVARNLRYLLLRFHGIHVAESDDGPIAPLRQLLADSGAGGWDAVCVALVTAPEFSLY